MAVNYNALTNMLIKGKEKNIYIHAMNIIKGGEVVCDFSVSPYLKTDRRQVYSMSKSFTSLAVGICFDEGKLSLDQTLFDIFPDEFDESCDENAKDIKIIDLLIMSSGHNFCSMEAIRNSENGVKTFLRIKNDYKCGTEFHYNTGATYMLSAIVQKVSSKTLVDFLDEKLFQPLGIEKPYWKTAGGGICEGGVGLYISSNDVKKFAQLLYNKGTFDGKRIISEKYLDIATGKHIATPPATIDWTQGYGFQFWRNKENGYRADGAVGQLCVVLPERDVVFTILGEVHNMQIEMDLCYKMLDELFVDEECGKEEFERIITELLVLPSEQSSDFSFVYDLNKDFDYIKLVSKQDNLIVEFSNENGKQTIYSKIGVYTNNQYDAKHLIPDFYTSPDRFSMKNIKSRVTHYFENGVLYLVNRYVEYPHTITWKFTFNDDDLILDFIPFTSAIIEEHSRLNGRKRIDNH